MFRGLNRYQYALYRIIYAGAQSVPEGSITYQWDRMAEFLSQKLGEKLSGAQVHQMTIVLKDKGLIKGHFTFGYGMGMTPLVDIPEYVLTNDEELFPTATVSEKEASNLDRTSSSLPNKVFLVHGQNENIKHTVARVLGKLGLDVIILHEQPNKGRTIIKKFEDESDVAYAVVLMTKEDIGYKSGRENEAKARARQNVILELGYFIAKLSRSKVCALYEDGVEIPSDYLGVLYISLGDGDWKLKLAKELKAIGLNINLESIT